MHAHNKIRSAYASLPYAERKVADFILENPERAIKMVINEIAEEAGVSVPSVTRLARRLGYKGFLEFRVALAGGSAPAVTAGATPQRLAPVLDFDSDYTVVDKVYGYSVMALEEMYRDLDKADFIAAARALAGKKRIFICSESQYVATDVAHWFNAMNVEAIPLYDDIGFAIYRMRFTADDALIAVSRSGRNKDIYDLIICAKAAGATTVYISSFTGNQSAHVCNHYFAAPSPVAAKVPYKTETTISLLTMSNMLVTLVARIKGFNIAPLSAKGR